MTITSKIIPVVRIKIAVAQPARRPEDDRDVIGYEDGLSEDLVWERGRKAWKMKADKVLAAELAIISHGGIVRAVGSVSGVSKQGDRLVIEGTVIPGHPLVGRADPLHNTSQNPVTYGSVSV